MESKSVRIRILWIATALVVSVYVGRLYWLQVINHETYADEASRQYGSVSGRVYNRGSIYFSERDGGLIAAASLRSGYLLAVNPSLIEDPASVEQVLEKSIPGGFSTSTKARLLKSDDTYEEIAHRLTDEQASSIEALDAPWSILVREKWRFYPGGRLASNVLGLVGYQGDEFSGRYGLERYYEDALSRSQSDVYRNFFTEIFSKAKGAIRDGLKGDIISTIEPNVQRSLEQTLQGLKNEWGPEALGGIIIDPKTGAIYGLATYPDFDPNSFSNEEEVFVFANPFVENVYEMGSIIKPITMAIGLDTGSVSATTTYNDEGYLVLDTKRIANFDGKGRGVVSMQEVLNQSLNTGVAFVEQRVGNKRFAEYMRLFGFGEETGIDLPGETHGLINNLDSPRTIEYATASYGQGIALTPIATVRALSALGNGGWLVTPHLVKQIRYESGVTRSVAPENKTRVISRQTSEEISRMLSVVYDDALLNGSVKMENYSIAAKTGTAQIAKEEGGGYYEDRYLHSFFGYFPAYDPQFLVFFYMVNPREVFYASQTLTMPFVDTTKFLINYYNIPPDR